MIKTTPLDFLLPVYPYGLEATFEVSSAFTFGGVSYTNARARDLSGRPEVSSFNYAVTLAFPDLGKEDNLAGIAISQPPKVTGMIEV